MERIFWLLIIHNELVFVFSIPDSDEEHDLQRRLRVHVCVNAENWDELWVYQWEPEPCVCGFVCLVGITLHSQGLQGSDHPSLHIQLPHFLPDTWFLPAPATWQSQVDREHMELVSQRLHHSGWSNSERASITESVSHHSPSRFLYSFPVTRSWFCSFPRNPPNNISRLDLTSLLRVFHILIQWELYQHFICDQS